MKLNRMLEKKTFNCSGMNHKLLETGKGLNELPNGKM